MNCVDRVAELVECARRGAEPDRELRAHLDRCERCSARWESEHQLSREFRLMRYRAAALMAADTQQDVLMREFAELRRPAPVRRWVFALAAAAAIFAAIFLGHLAGRRTHQVRATPRIAQAVLYEASADASALSGDDFIAVPYTPPLAPGELIRVVHTDLHPEALARMGIDVDPEWASEIPADVVVGEDGIPRAVRITENGQ